MKKMILMAATLALASVSNAQEVVDTKEFTDKLWVTVNDETTGPQETSVTVEYLDNGNINLVLNNFVLDSGDGNDIPVGNIAVYDMPLTQGEEESYESFSYNGDVTIEDGEEGTEWVGPWLLGTIPIDLSGCTEGEKFYLTIDIDLTSSLGQVIYVKFGEMLENAVKSVTAETKSVYDNKIYDICGRQMSSTRRPGIFIVNGKKVLVK